MGFAALATVSVVYLALCFVAAGVLALKTCVHALLQALCTPAAPSRARVR